jgi:hypothetical protein
VVSAKDVIVQNNAGCVSSAFDPKPQLAMNAEESLINAFLLNLPILVVTIPGILLAMYSKMPKGSFFVGGLMIISCAGLLAKFFFHALVGDEGTFMEDPLAAGWMVSLVAGSFHALGLGLCIFAYVRGRGTKPSSSK